MQKTVKIGTRASLLAMTQSTTIKNLIEKQYPGTTVELVKIITKGDKILDVPLAKVGGKGLFVKELEDALLNREVDIAVHSMKDVPSELPEELHIGIVTKREDPSDAFMATKYASLKDLPNGAKIGTSSLRRKAQLAHLRPDVVIDDLRGNLDTRLRKLNEGMYDAIILATAGLNRMNWSDQITDRFTPEEMLPAVAQGANGIELRKDCGELLAGLSFLNHDETAIAVVGERAFLHRLEGGCQVPIGAYATIDGNTITITGLIASVDGKEMLKKSVSGSIADAASLGRGLAEDLLTMGGRRILEEVYGASIQ
ncbi:MAG: hydroxymethylbilane synthase [Proteobacteria bacterium]|nr:hydroxymethylbilane synthase [Pseudomonadota bacterium]MBU1686477.1 hydroxymethylbilane synthase [Pseudomonadota bacterium]